MRPPSLGQARSRADTLFSAGMVLVEASEGVRSFRASPRAVSRIAVSILAKDHQVRARASTYWIAIRDFYSLVQIAADNLVIVALSVLSGIANHEMFLNGSGPINGLIAYPKNAGYGGILRDIGGFATLQARLCHVV